MGRDIREVPEGWEHPLKDGFDYIPMYDQTLREAQAEWDKGKLSFTPDEDYESFEDYEGERPTEGDHQYRPEYDKPANHVQMYENVSEGTPVSPVFKTRQELADWLVKEKGYSREAADGFCESGYAPSMVMENGKIYDGVEACAILNK